MDLLTNCSQVVDKVLDSRDEMLRTWADLPLVTAVCEAMKQMHMRHVSMDLCDLQSFNASARVMCTSR